MLRNIQHQFQYLTTRRNDMMHTQDLCLQTKLFRNSEISQLLPLIKWHPRPIDNIQVPTKPSLILYP